MLAANVTKGKSATGKLLLIDCYVSPGPRVISGPSFCDAFGSARQSPRSQEMDGYNVAVESDELR